MQGKVREMTAEDIPSVANIEKICFSHPWSEKMISDTFQRDYSRFFVYEAEGQICGYVGAIITFDEAETLNVATLPNFRRKGIARALIRCIIDEVKQCGANRLFLEVRRKNEGAIRLYTGLGFKQIGERKNYYGTDDALIFQLTL